MKPLTRWLYLGCVLLVVLLPMGACFSWTQEPKQPTEASLGSTNVPQWDFDSAGESFLFLLISRNTSTSNNSSEEDIAVKLSNGSIHVYDTFKSRAQWINPATLALQNIEESDQGTYCCQAFYLQVMYTSCVDLLVLAPPAIVVHPKDTSIIEFKNFISFCNASGQPRPRITWRRKGKGTVFPPGEYFFLPNISRHDTGLYECTAHNSVGQVSAQFRITVFYEPTAHVIPGNLTVNQSDLMSLTCMTSGNPFPNVTWTLDGNTSVVLSADNKLELKITSKADQGRYRCTASNGIGFPSTSSAYVVVKHHRPVNTSFISCSSDNTAWVNDGIVFTCSSVSSPYPADYVIYHNGKIIRRNKSGYHKICNVKPHHAGTYTCEPRNSFGVGERRSIRLIVYEKAAVHVIPRVMNVTEGSHVLFICQATGSPPPNITWTAMSSGEIYNGEKLEIKAVHRNDTGDYQCLASNEISGPARDTTFLNVYYSPTITNTAGPKLIVTAGGTLKLYCHSNGNPQPVITWKLLDTNQTLYSEDERLVVHNTHKSQAGVYLCTASNFLGNVSKTIAVDVWYKPFNTSLYSSANSGVVKFNSSVTITCRTNSNPPPHIYTFYKDGVIVQEGAADSYNITQASYRDQGVYTCVPENAPGRGLSAVFNLTVQEIPEPPVIIQLESGSSYIRVTWKAPKSTREGPVISYLVQAIDEKNPNNVLNCSDVTNNSCTIYGLEPDTTYLVRLQASNAKGYRLLAHEKVVTKYKGYSKSNKRKTENGANKGLSTTMLVSLLAGIAGAIVVIVVVSLLVKRCRSTGKASITED